MSRSLRAFLVLAIAVGALVFAGTASASQYNQFVPGGLPQSSPAAATAAVVQYAQVNADYGQVIAAQTGAASFSPSDYQAQGWGTASASSLNSAITIGSGRIVSYKDSSSVGVKTVRIRNKKTGVLVDVMVRCGNPRLRAGGAPRVAKIKILKIMKVLVNKRFTITKSIVCPSGQKVTGTVTGSVKGWVKFRVHGWTTGAKLWYNQQVDLKATTALKLACSGTPPTPGQPIQAPGNTTVVVQQTIVCGNGAVAAGNNNAASAAGNNCNTTVVVTPPAPTPVPPKPPKPPTPPTPPVNHKPTGSIAPPQHVYVNGQAKVCVDNVSDPDGDQVSVTFSVTAGSMYGAVFTQPGGAMCQSYQAPSDPQQVTATAVLTDGKGGSLTLLDNFPVIPDQF